jgi:hypothetical protein
MASTENCWLSSTTDYCWSCSSSRAYEVQSGYLHELASDCKMLVVSSSVRSISADDVLWLYGEQHSRDSYQCSSQWRAMHCIRVRSLGQRG